MSNPPPNAAAPRSRRWLWIIAAIALAAYGVFLAWNFSPVAAGADSSGYLNSARLLASGQIAIELRAPPEFGPQEKLWRAQFQPHGFAPFEGRRKLSPTYAVGLPLHLAVAGKLLGWTAGPIAVGVGGALAAVLLCFLVARQFGVTPPLAVAGAVTLAAYPPLIYMSLQPLSDVLATVWCLAAVAAALRAEEEPAWALGAGMAFAIAVLVRATNILLLPALGLLLGLNPRRLAFALLGALPGAAWLAYYNRALYGGALQSGYVNISDAFHWKYGAPTLVHFGQWLALMLPAVLLPLAAWAFARRAVAIRLRAALAVWFGAFFVVYLFYEISHEVWWDLRFILPGTPALIIAGLLGVQAIARTTMPRVLGAAVIAVWAIALGWYWPQKFHLLLTKKYERDYADAAKLALAKLSPDTLVLAGHQSGALYFYTPFAVLRWELVNAAEFDKYRALTEKAGRPVAALLYDSEEKEALQDHCRGNWQRVASVNHVTLWRLEKGSPSPATPPPLQAP